MCFSLEQIKDIVTIFGILVGGTIWCWTLFDAYRQFLSSERQKRAEHFFNIRKQYNNNKVYCDARSIIDNEGDFDVFFNDLNIDDKRSLFGFYEEIAILTNSRLINDEVAFYMFGYYFTEFMKRASVKAYLEPEKEYWQILLQFSNRMELYKQNIKNFDYSKVVF